MTNREIDILFAVKVAGWSRVRKTVDGNFVGRSPSEIDLTFFETLQRTATKRTLLNHSTSPARQSKKSLRLSDARSPD